MAGGTVSDGPQQRKLVGDRCVPGEDFGDLQTGSYRIDGLKRTADFRGGTGLRVIRVDVAGAAVTEQDDNGRTFALVGGAGFGPQAKQAWQRQTSGSSLEEASSAKISSSIESWASHSAALFKCVIVDALFDDIRRCGVVKGQSDRDDWRSWQFGLLKIWD